MALDILSISAMSDELERMFSEAHHMISWERAQMNAETLKCVEYLKYWK
jgi:hAT family C-terminal dimerisation region